MKMCVYYCNIFFNIYHIVICLSMSIILQYVFQYLSYCIISFQYLSYYNMSFILNISSIYHFCYFPWQSHFFMITEIWGTKWITEKGRDFPANPKLPPHWADSGIVSAISPHPTDFCRLCFRFFGPSQGEILF